MKKYVDFILELLGDAIVVFHGAWSIYTFYLIVRYRAAYFIEPNLWILYTELGLSVLAFFFGWWLVVGDARAFRDKWR